LIKNGVRKIAVIQKGGKMPTARERFERFLAVVGEATKFEHGACLAEWDQRTKMPRAGVVGGGRAEVVAALRALAHERFVSEKTKEVIEDVLPHIDELNVGEKAAVLRAKELFDKLSAITPDLMEEYTRVSSNAETVWRHAKGSGNFSLFAPHLEKIIDLVLEFADAYGYQGHPLNALLPKYEPGINTEFITTLIEQLKRKLVPLIEQLIEQPRPDDSFLKGNFDVGKQRQLSIQILRTFGYDFTRGRLDETEHPFTITVGPHDVRVTTKFIPDDITAATFSTAHEGGHALYDQNRNEDLWLFYFGDIFSYGLHESQSRTWENQVGRSREWWTFFYPKLQEIFPEFKDVSFEDFYRAINIVENSPIRIYADEVTYMAHIMLRFELEMGLLSKDIKVDELPGEWNTLMKNYLNITPANDSEGVLQDVHWSAGYFGYFPTYMLGSLWAAQFFRAAKRDISDLGAQIEKGNLGVLLEWQKSRIHEWGLVQDGRETVERVTGEEAGIDAYLDYVEAKFVKDIYGLN
jgi:carboxypeptidase Taq